MWAGNVAILHPPNLRAWRREAAYQSMEVGSHLGYGPVP